MSKRTLTIKLPQMACITVSGPCQVGKSIVIDRIKKMLEQEFDSSVVSTSWEKENRLANMDNLDAWERKMIRNTVWYIKETNEGDE